LHLRLFVQCYIERNSNSVNKATDQKNWLPSTERLLNPNYVIRNVQKRRFVNDTLQAKYFNYCHNLFFFKSFHNHFFLKTKVLNPICSKHFYDEQGNRLTVTLTRILSARSNESQTKNQTIPRMSEKFIFSLNTV
jgi:hypothetical protein